MDNFIFYSRIIYIVDTYDLILNSFCSCLVKNSYFTNSEMTYVIFFSLFNNMKHLVEIMQNNKSAQKRLGWAYSAQHSWHIDLNTLFKTLLYLFFSLTIFFKFNILLIC